MSQRKRKTHTKSRRGCCNCKIRRVKCDEGKPGCSKCASYGITCNYGDPEVQSLFGSGGPLTCSNNETVMTMINANLSGRRPVRYQLRERDIELLHLFQNHTVYTMGTRDTVHIYRNEIVREAATHPWLMHCMLAFASMHRRDFSGLAATAEEEYHWYQGAALFRDLLSRPVQNEDKDAIWATAAILGASGFYKIHASSPEEAWPLNPEEDLGWLALSDGKKAIWKIADLSRPESVFNPVVKDHQQGFEVDWTAVPPNFRKAGIEGLPYHAAALTVASLLEVECNHSTILRFLAFIGRVQPEYRNLLEQKDSRALLILAYWYAKVCTYNQWWVRKRANLECRSICMYLDRYHSDDEEVMRLAAYPKMMCGILPRDKKLADGWGRTGDLILPHPGPDNQTMVDLGNLCGMQSSPSDTEV